MVSTQLTFTCSKLTKETLKKCVKYVRWTVHFRPTFPSDRNQKIYLHCKSITVFLVIKTMELNGILKQFFYYFVCQAFIDLKFLSYDRFYGLLGFMIFSIFVVRFLILNIIFEKLIIRCISIYSPFGLAHLIPHITILTLTF